MRFPYKIIESTISNRSQFVQVEGYQPSHALFYLKKGVFTIELDGSKEEIKEGECVILPDYIYFRRSVLNPIEFLYIKFTQNPKCPYSISIPFGKIVPKDYVRFVRNIELIEELSDNTDAQSTGYIEHLLLDILFQLSYEHQTENGTTDNFISRDHLVSAAIAYVDSHIQQKILIEDICREIGTNASTLNFKFRREMNLSIGQFITSARLKRGKRLLTSTTYSISEIAHRCGFENVYYFSNTFKRNLGLWPSEYRRG